MASVDIGYSFDVLVGETDKHFLRRSTQTPYVPRYGMEIQPERDVDVGLWDKPKTDSSVDYKFGFQSRSGSAPLSGSWYIFTCIEYQLDQTHDSSYSK